VARRHIVLVGLPGSGKTTVGELAAGRLGAPFVDLDRLIEHRAGRSVERIFAEQGEEGFRNLETEAGLAALLSGEPAVIAPGAGWFTDPARLGRTSELGYAIYLRTSPRIAAQRLGSHAGRPLLKGFDLTLRLAQLLQQREAGYLQAPAAVSTDELSPAEVAAEVVALARSGGGW